MLLVQGSVQTAINGHLSPSAFSDIGFLDAERIEILSGPQGTLHTGRNVTGGLINPVSARPTGDTSGYAKMDYGTLGQTRISTAVNMPIADNVSARIAYGSYSQDRTIKNLNLGTDIDDRDANSFRISVDYDMDASNTIQFTHEEHDFEDWVVRASRYCSRVEFLGWQSTVRGDYNQEITHPAVSRSQLVLQH